MNDTLKNTICCITEGPLAFDGHNYLFSEGAGYYIDSIAKHFGYVKLLTYAFRKNDFYYRAVAHYKMQSQNIVIVELPLFKSSGFAPKIFQFWQSARQIWKNIDKSDAFYIFLPGYSGAIGALLCQVKRKPYFVYLASDWPEEAETLNPIKGDIGKVLLPFYRYLISWLQNRAVDKAKFLLVHGRALVKKYMTRSTPLAETIPRLFWPAYKINTRLDTCTKRKITLLFVGYLIERKGANYFVETLNILKKQGLHICGVVVGAGEDEDFLKVLVRNIGLENEITFTGYLPNGEPLISQYRNADIFICPSFSGEGFPRVLYEAMSQGLPIISSDVCGISLKLKPDHNALFVPPRDPNAIALQVVRLIEDEVLRKKLIQNGYKFMFKLINDSDGGQQIANLYCKYLV